MFFVWRDSVDNFKVLIYNCKQGELKMFNVVSVEEVLDGVANYKHNYNEYLKANKKDLEKESGFAENGLFCLIAIGDLRNYIYFEIIKINQDLNWTKNLDKKIDIKNYEECLNLLNEAEKSVLEIINNVSEMEIKREKMQ